MYWFTKLNFDDNYIFVCEILVPFSLSLSFSTQKVNKSPPLLIFIMIIYLSIGL